jgi:hypothetical protein
MATFSPPTRPGNPVTAAGGHPANPLMRFYGAWEQGPTIWKDSLGAWHEDMTAYLGGATHAVYNGAQGTIFAPDEGLATAQVVYLGGHVATISEAAANELIAAGFGEGILTRQSIAEPFTGANGPLAGAVDLALSWERKVFTHANQFQVNANQVRLSSTIPGTFEDIALPTPNVDSPNLQYTLNLNAITRVGSASYVADIGGVCRFQPLNAGTSYRGYAFGIGRSNVFLPGVDLWHLAMFRVDNLGVQTLIASDFELFANVTLPGTLTFTASGSTLTALFTHAGGGGPLGWSVSDSTYADGAVALGGSVVVNGSDSASIDADNFAVGPAP